MPPLPEDRWRELWLQAVSGSLYTKRKLFVRRTEEPSWPSELWLEFAGAPVIRLTAFEFEFWLQLDESAPRETEPSREASYVKELTALPPFADVVGSPLRAINAIYWGDQPRSKSPGGMRLQFEHGDVWIMAVLGDTQIYDRRPPYWDKDGCQFG